MLVKSWVAAAHKISSRSQKSFVECFELFELTTFGGLFHIVKRKYIRLVLTPDRRFEQSIHRSGFNQAPQSVNELDRFVPGCV
jgi:hypothetical protein